MNVEIKSEVDALKRDLYMYRELVVRFNNVLEWEQPFYPLYMIATISILFFLTWYLSPPFLMIFSALGLLYFSFNLLAPRFLPVLLGKSEWDEHKEHNFTGICVRLVHAWKHLLSLKSTIYHTEKNNPKYYYPAMLMVCGAIITVGMKINAFLLMYIISVVLSMIPGLRRHKMQDYFQENDNVKSEPMDDDKNENDKNK